MSEGSLRSSSAGPSEGSAAKQTTTPLIQAILKQDKSSFKKLIESAAIDATDGEQRTALHWATIKEESDFVKAILKRKPNVNALDKRRYSPLHYAAEACNFKIFESLMKAGADHRLLTADDNSILHLAVIGKPHKNSSKILKFVLESPNHSLEINKPNKAAVPTVALLTGTNGETPLFHAIINSNPTLVKALIEHNPDLNVRSLKGVCLIDAAKEKPELFEIIKKHMATIPGGDRRLRQVSEEQIIIATKTDELPADLKKYVQHSELRPELIDAHWDVFCNVVHFVAKKRIVVSEEEAQKVREKKKERDERHYEKDHSPSLTIARLQEELIKPGNPKDMFKKLTPTGKGGFGMVFSAITPDKTKVAIKRMPHASERDKRNNLKEVKFLHDYPHPNIVKFRGAYEVPEDHEIWVCMEFLEGGTLDDAVGEDYEFQEKHIAFVCKEILQALQFLHSRNVAHRDLKAANVMMSVEGEVKLIDFGLAVDLSSGPRTEMVGSPFWMPPEMILKKPHSYPCDLWSMAICILELANKEPPNSTSAIRSMFNVAVDKIPGLDRPEKWSDAFKAFLNQCLQREPEKRATAEALLQDPFLKMSAKQQDMKQVLRQIFMGNQLKENGFF